MKVFMGFMEIFRRKSENDCIINEIKEELITKCKMQIAKLEKSNPDIYIVAITCDSDINYVGIASNTSSYYESIIKDEDMYYYYKYCESEWKNAITFSELSKKIQMAKEDRLDEEFDEFRKEIIQMCVAVAKEIKIVYPKLLITVCVEEFLGKEERINCIKEINGDESSEEYVSHIDDFV